MDDETGNANLRDRLTRSGEDALGKLAQDLLENPLVTGAIARAFDAREKASAAQETAMSALNLPSAADLERLTRRLRSVSQRLEGIEDGVDRLEGQLSKLAADVAALAGHLDAAPVAQPREQERLEVDRPAAARKRARAKKPASS
jgi:CRP-like cAMP-binding protein